MCDGPEMCLVALAPVVLQDFIAAMVLNTEHAHLALCMLVILQNISKRCLRELCSDSRLLHITDGSAFTVQRPLLVESQFHTEKTYDFPSITPQHISMNSFVLFSS